MCREAAGSEPAAGGTDGGQISKAGVQSCQEPLMYFPAGERVVSGIIPQMAAADL